MNQVFQYEINGLVSVTDLKCQKKNKYKVKKKWTHLWQYNGYKSKQIQISKV